MRSKTPFSGLSRWLFIALSLMACGGFARGQMTTFTGTVYSPKGPTAGDPIPNILVFIADPNNPPPAFGQGVVLPTSGQDGCLVQPSLVPTTYLGEATTDYKGTYTFQTYGALPTPNIDVVIQAGKWRLQTQIPTSTITLGAVNTLPPLSMPSSHTTVGADLPHIAVITGSSDAIECIFRQIGISDSEITDTNNSATSGGSIDLYEGESSGGEIYAKPAVLESTLVSSPSNLAQYDLVMFGCQGGTGDTNAPTYANNLTTYTSASGRVFGTHFEYIWLEDNSTFKPVATWGGSFSGATNVNYPALLNVSGNFPQGVILGDWLNYIGALTTDTPPTIALDNVRQNTTAVNLPAVSWANLIAGDGSYTGSPSMQFSFDTPIGASGTPTVAISYTNNTAALTQGDTSDSITLTVTNNGTVATTPGLLLTISLPAGFTVTSLADSVGGNWVCTAGTPTSTCTLPTALAAGGMDSVLLAFSISGATPVGQVSLSATLSGGGITNSQQCGRVLYNDYHVENPGTATGGIYSNGKLCPVQTSLNGAQKFLEYSLYNLSNFVTPSTTDLLEIHGPTQIVWGSPASIPYGTLLSSTQLNATLIDPDNNASVAGTCSYSPAAGNEPSVPGVTVTATCSPTDTTDYLSPQSFNEVVPVSADATTTTLTGVVSPIFYGQIIAQLAPEGASSNGPANLDANGALNFYINGALACSIPWPVVPQPACPATTGAGYDAGPNPYTVYSAYVPGDLNFSPSQSSSSTVLVNPDVTTGALVSSVNPSVPGQAVTLTATISAPYATPVGTVTFYDGTTVLGTGTVNASGAAMLTTSNLVVGAHSITASYVAPAASQGIADFLPVTTTAILQIITFPPTLTPTITTLATSDTPSVVGQSVTFSASVGSTAAFITIPTGSVTFLDGTTPLGVVTLDGSGNAILTTSSLTAGTHNITAVYAGTATISGSTSPVVVQQVYTSLNEAATDFILTVTPTSLTVGAGNSISVNVTVTELNNFNTPVQLSCAGLPYETTCAFDTSLIPAEGGTTRLVISPSAPHTCGTSTPYFVASSGILPLLGFGTLIVMFRRRRVLRGIALAAALCILPYLSGCSGTCTDLATKPGTYTFTVTGTSTAPVTVVVGPGSSSQTVTHSQTMTLTVTI